MDDPRAHEDSGVEFHLQLNCTSRKTVESKRFTLDEFPGSVLDLKKAVEAQLSIPVCVQSVSYQLAPLSDGDSLTERRIRSGDTLSISYLCEGDCEAIRDIIQWLRQVYVSLRSNNASYCEVLIRRGMSAGYIESLPIEILGEWLNPKAYASKLYFESQGGLTVLCKLYRNLADRKWSTMPQLYKYLEGFAIQTIGNFGENFYLRRISLKEDVLDLVMSSLLRKRLEVGEDIEGFGDTGDHAYEGELWRALLIDSIYTIANFSELPECQLQIVSHRYVLYQVLIVAESDRFPSAISVVVAAMFVCLCHDSTSHHYLCEGVVVSGLYRVVEMQSKRMAAGDPALAALKCFTFVVFAQLALVSPHLLLPHFIDTITSDMNKFLSTHTSPEEIGIYEDGNGFAWATFLPYVKLFYVPQSSEQLSGNSSCQQMQRLTEASERIILFFLHSKMSRKYAHDILIKEGLMDYVTAIPWHVSKESKSAAETVVAELHSHVKLQPPKLCSIVQAKLARLHFGLEKVVACHSPVDLIRSVL